MKRRDLLSGILSAVTGVLAWPGNVFGFGIFQIGGPSGIPAGVTLRPIDGGSTFYATGWGGVPFSNATAYPATIVWPHGSGTINYTNGWDDPKFFGIGGFNDSMSNGTDASTWIGYGWSWMQLTFSTSSLSAFSGAGISLMAAESELHLLMANNSGSLGSPSPVTILGGVDEPQNPAAWSVAIGGSASDAFGNLAAVLGTSAVTASGSGVLSFKDTTTNGTNIWPVAGMKVTDVTVPANLAGGTTVSSTTTTSVTVSPVATGTIGVSLTTNGATPNNSNVLHFASVPAGVIVGQTIFDITTPAAFPGGQVPHVASTTSTTVTMSEFPGGGTGPGVSNGDNIVFGDIMAFGGNITNAIQAGRPWSTTLSGAAFLVDQKLGGVVQTPFSNTYNTPTSVARRPYDHVDADWFPFPSGSRAEYWGQIFWNAIAGGGSSGIAQTISKSDLTRGPLQGLMVDYLRNWCTTPGDRPITGIVGMGNAFANVAFMMGGPEINWESWSCVVHGARQIAYFDRNNVFYTPQSGGWTSVPNGFLANPECVLTTQSVTFTGTISGNTLTVSGMTNSPTVGTTATFQPIQPGMEITVINGVTQSPPVLILSQLTYNTEATFFGTTPGGNPSATMTVSSIGGTPGFIPIPSHLDTSGSSDVITGLPTAGGHDIWIQEQLTGATPGGNGTYTLANYNGYGAHGVSSGNPWKAYCPGMNGTYAVSGGSGTSVSMTAKLADPITLGYNSAGTNSGTSSLVKQVSAIAERIRDLAPVINSKFAVGTVGNADGYVLPTTTNIRYIFPYAIITGVHQAVPKDAFNSGGGAGLTHAKATGIDCCVHYYQGPTYTSSQSGETISTNTFYIFATTANHEESIGPFSCTFNTADTTATSVTAIGEGRANISVVGGSFTDTFQYAWTVHVYRVNH